MAPRSPPVQVMSAPPPTSFAPPVQEAVDGPAVVPAAAPGRLVTGVPLTRTTEMIPAPDGPVEPVGPCEPCGPWSPVADPAGLADRSRLRRYPKRLSDLPDPAGR